MLLNQGAFYSGKESLLLDGKQTDYTMLNFWQLSMSDILFNMNRGTFAEFIVRCALHNGGFNALSEFNGTIDAFDITGPIIPSLNRSSRIEVKSASFVQSGTQPEQEPVSLPDSRLRFDIRKKTNPKDDPRIEKRNNDLYVFCIYGANYVTDNILDLKYWRFLVLPTFKIDGNSKYECKNSISAFRLKKLGAVSCDFTGLYETILKALSEISSQYE